VLLLSGGGCSRSGLDLSMLLRYEGRVLGLVLRLVLLMVLGLMVMVLLLLMLQPGRFGLRILMLVGEDVLALSLKHGERGSRRRG
jgi:hypothetical protein